MPTMTVRPLRAPYGGTVVLTRDLVIVSDADTELEDLIFTLEQQPRHGNVTDDGRVMTEGDHFTFEHLVNSLIR